MPRKDTPEYIHKIVRDHIERMYEDIAEDIADENGVISKDAWMIVRGHLGLINFHKFKVYAEQENTFEE